MLLFDKIFGKKTIQSPIFVKDFSKDNPHLAALNELSSNTDEAEQKDNIEKDIMLLKYGIDGENNVYYELKNSFLPILCLHDVRIVYGDYVAQLDFVVISNKFTCILETKKLSGDIEIDSDGNFVRTLKNRYGKKYKEGIYSPVTQNTRHVDILKHVLSKELKINNMPVLSLVVMANPKTIIKKNKCPLEIEKTIIKYDQIKATLGKYQNDKMNTYDLAEKDRYDIANLLVQMNKPIDMDFNAKYQITVETHAIDETQLRDKLIAYRLETSRAEEIKAYQVFSNKELDDLIDKCPKTVNELLEVKGFGKVKVEKYGQQILNILSGNS